MIEHRKQSKADCFLCYWQIRSRYSDGVLPVIFLKVVQKLLSLVNPVPKQISLMVALEDFSRNFALFTRAVMTYPCGVKPVSFLNILLK